MQNGNGIRFYRATHPYGMGTSQKVSKIPTFFSPFGVRGLLIPNNIGGFSEKKPLILKIRLQR
jgi:hypothetical protein